jgi:hypothetical protein
MLQSFYSNVAQAAFTLLGLWWVVLQLRYGPWMRNKRIRRAVYDISLYFLLPGMMSLMSLLATDVSTIWRVSFAAAGIVGTLESIVSLATTRGHDSPARLVDIGNWASLVLYPAVAAIAIRRTIPTEIGIHLHALEAEGVLVAALLALGVLLGAALFITVDAAQE